MAASSLPTFAQLQKNYPTGDSYAQVKADIGGGVTEGWLGDNTCVIRMSKAFNYAAGTRFAIPGNYAGMLTVKGADKMNYAIRVMEFIDFLTTKYGAANIIKLGEAIEEKPFFGKTGIIAWSVNGWNDARGHFTLWNGSKGLYVGGHDYWVMPKKKLPPVNGITPPILSSRSSGSAEASTPLRTFTRVTSRSTAAPQGDEESPGNAEHPAS